MHKVTVSTKGQIVIPAELRKNLSINRGTVLYVYSRGRQIVMVPEAPDPVSHGLGLLKRSQANDA